MLDSDLAEVYGYETRYMNLQVKRNISRFPEDFMFQLTKGEYENLMLQIATSSLEIPNHGGRRKMPYVFTEQGIYQLATVLKGEFAEKQSIKIMRIFKMMREYISQNTSLLPQQDLLNFSKRQDKLEDEVKEIKNNMVKKTDLSCFMKLFDSGIKQEEILILDGEPFKADIAYQKIYKKAKKNIFIIDDYIGIKTLQHLAYVKQNIKIKIFSDNKAKTPLRLYELEDFNKEYPKLNVEFFKTLNKIHDRYIVVDYKTKDKMIYHCGGSSKDAGKKITTITNIKDIKNYDDIIKNLLSNTPHCLK